METVYQKLFYVFFFLRRIAYLAMAFGSLGIPIIFQFYGILLLNFITLIYYGFCYPHKHKLDRRIDLTNEFLIMYFTFMLMS